MPIKPLDNLPTSLARNAVGIDKSFENLNELKINGLSTDQKPEDYKKPSHGENLEHLDVPYNVSPSTYPMSNLLKQAKGALANSNLQDKTGFKETSNNQQSADSQPYIQAQIQSKEADVQALAELTLVLNKKEAVVSELRYMNDDVVEKQRDGDGALKDSEPFKMQYATVLVQLNEVNEQVSSALCWLRQWNTYQGNSLITWSRTAVNFGESNGSLSAFDLPANHTEESGTHGHEIVESSRIKAKTMVDAAMQALSSLKEGGNTIDRIEEAIDYVSNRLSLDDYCTVAMYIEIKIY